MQCVCMSVCVCFTDIQMCADEAHNLVSHLHGGGNTTKKIKAQISNRLLATTELVGQKVYKSEKV